MKRKKQIIIYLLLIIVCLESYMWLNYLQWSPKAVFSVSQRMDNVGPVDEILTEVDCGDGKKAILGREGENLYFCTMQRTKGIFWRRSGAEYFTRAYLEEYEQIILARYYWKQGFSLWYLQRTWSKRNFFPAGGRRGKFPNGRKTACQRRWYFLWQQYQRYQFGWKRLSLSFACFGRRRKCHCWRSGRCPVKTGHLF